MAETAKMIHVRPDPEDYEIIAARAEAKGISVPAETRNLIKRGLMSGVTQAELERALDARMAEAEALAAKRDEQMAEALRQMGIARKNIGKATRASYGSLSLLSWLYADLMGFFKGVGVKGSRVEGFSRLSVADVFKLFEGSGGSLQADPATRYFPSFKTALRSEPFRSMDVEDVTGVGRAEWDRLTGESDDAAAVRGLAGRGGGRWES